MTRSSCWRTRLATWKQECRASRPRKRGASEIAFTVTSISLSLVAVFLPILAMGGMLGRLFREFAVVLAAAVLISLVLSLTTTPMMCAAVLTPVA